MNSSEFAELQEGEFFHARIWGDEWRVLENKQDKIKAVCTKTGKFFNEGAVDEWNKEMGEGTECFLEQYEIGKNPKQAVQ
jgi:hypothetical protein